MCVWCVFLCVGVCVCVFDRVGVLCVWEGEEGGSGGGDGGWMGVVFVVPSRSVPQDNWSSTASSGKANDWRNRARVVLNLFSNLKIVRSSGYFR